MARRSFARTAGRRSAACAATLSLHLDARRAAWLSMQGGPLAQVLLRLVDQAIRKDVLSLALRDERDVELLVRARARALQREVTSAHERVGRRARAEREVLRRLLAGADPVVRAAAERLQLRRQIESGAVPAHRRRRSAGSRRRVRRSGR